MRKALGILGIVLCAASLMGQTNRGQTNIAQANMAPAKRLWILRETGEMVEYDPATFAPKQTVKVPADAAKSAQNVAVNHLGQILYAPSLSLPLADSDLDSPHKAWFWNGHSSVTIDLGLKREIAPTGSNLAVTESSPALYLSADGEHLFWFADQQHRLEREDVDLSVTTTWQAWRTDLAGAQRLDLTSIKLPECRCPTGSCEDSCPLGVVWVPDDGVGKFVIMSQFVVGKDSPAYKASSVYREDDGHWSATSLTTPLHRVLDASPDGNVIVEAIPDSGCCGWSNQSDDQTVVHSGEKTQTLFDEQATYKNPDYDVSFFTVNAHLSPLQTYLAMTITSTAKPNQAIQLAEQGQANPEESKEIRRALTELPAVEVKTLEDTLRRMEFLPHATLMGWINDKEILIVEDGVLVAYHLGTGARRKSAVRVEDAARVFLR